MNLFNRVVISDLSQLSVCGDNLNDFWDTILLKKEFHSQRNIRTGRFCYFVPEMEKIKNKYEEFLRLAIIPLLHRLEEETTNLIIGSSYGYNSSILNGASSIFPPHYRMEKIINKKLSFYCNISTSCTASLNAIGYGYKMIKSGQFQHVIVGGCEVLDDYIISGMDSLRVLSQKEKSNPFSKNRDGAVLGEGSAFFVLKSLDSAIKNKNKILAEIIGYANINDAHDTTRPDISGWGLISTMKGCLEDLFNHQQIEYVNSHGTGTYYNDLMETNALKEIFGYKIITSTIKPVIGHTLGACGAFETLACILALQHQAIPPTLSDGEVDKSLDLDYCFNKSRNLPIDYIMKNSVGFWGNNASILLKRWMS